MNEIFLNNMQQSMLRFDRSSWARFLNEALENVRTVRYRKITYFNCAAAFDIETSSFLVNGEKQACMYLWAFGINGRTVYGRTWEELTELMKLTQDILSLSDTKRLIVYVHNLAYDFQFLRTHCEWEKVFALDTYKPVRALSEYGIEFKCSYQLSGYKLEKLGEELQTYHVEKLVGALDYDLVRHSRTELTQRELDYQRNDVLVVMAYIQETIERDGGIIKIPLTKTGYVRNYTRNACLYSNKEHRKDKKFNKYRKLMNKLQLTPELFTQLQHAFQGGFTHANALAAGRVLYDIGSIDFTSSYPAQIVAQEYPMSSALPYTVKDIDDLEKQCRLYCCLFDVKITGLQAKLFQDHPLSKSKCYGVENPYIDNGRIVSADLLYTTLTEQDYFTLKDFYTWDNLEVANFSRFMKAYLPTDFIKAVLKLYADKTQLKGVPDKQVEYLLSKGMLNATYGMTVTSPVRPLYVYDGSWSAEAPELEKAILKYNRSKSRFLYYAWGVWVTAYARRALFTGIKAFGSDYVYADTDSIKALNMDKHTDYINAYNAEIVRKLDKACIYHGIDPAATRPENIKGEPQQLGVWDYEGTYQRFKTLGAKRYLTEQDGKLKLTVAGLSKQEAIKYMQHTFGDNTAVFEAFNDELYIPADATGKKTHTYIDEPMQGTVTDYMGVTSEYNEGSGIHLSGADYTLSIGRLYLDYIRSLHK